MIVICSVILQFGVVDEVYGIVYCIIGMMQAVIMSSGMPDQPMYPPTQIAGNKLGISPIRPIRTLWNTIISITPIISTEIRND